jgi:hypothetical protein
MTATNGTITLGSIADLFSNLAAEKAFGSLLLVRDYDMCKFYLEYGTIVHTELTQIDPSHSSSLSGETGLRLISKILLWNKGMYTYNAQEAAPTRSVNIQLDWHKVAADLARSGQPSLQTSSPRINQTAASRGGHQGKKDIASVNAYNSSMHKAHTATIMDLPIRLKSSISAAQGPFDSKVRNQVVGRGGGFIRTQTQIEDKRSIIFKLIDNRRTIRDIAAYLGWGIDDIKNVLAQLLAEGAIDILPAKTVA